MTRCYGRPLAPSGTHRKGPPSRRGGRAKARAKFAISCELGTLNLDCDAIGISQMRGGEHRGRAPDMVELVRALEEGADSTRLDHLARHSPQTQHQTCRSPLVRINRALPATTDRPDRCGGRRGAVALGHDGPRSGARSTYTHTTIARVFKCRNSSSLVEPCLSWESMGGASTLRGASMRSPVGSLAGSCKASRASPSKRSERRLGRRPSGIKLAIATLRAWSVARARAGRACRSPFAGYAA